MVRPVNVDNRVMLSMRFYTFYACKVISHVPHKSQVSVVNLLLF